MKNPSFRESAKDNRGFDQSTDFKKPILESEKAFAFCIDQKPQKPLVLGGLSGECIDQESRETHCTFSRLSTRGNIMLAKIHNISK